VASLGRSGSSGVSEPDESVSPATTLSVTRSFDELVDEPLEHAATSATVTAV
jgi:hypothetical protein